jgi:hypothetical protein
MPGQPARYRNLDPWGFTHDPAAGKCQIKLEIPRIITKPSFLLHSFGPTDQS